MATVTIELTVHAKSDFHRVMSALTDTLNREDVYPFIDDDDSQGWSFYVEDEDE